jgi:hypothetical protein
MRLPGLQGHHNVLPGVRFMHKVWHAARLWPDISAPSPQRSKKTPLLPAIAAARR